MAADASAATRESGSASLGGALGGVEAKLTVFDRPWKVLSAAAGRVSVTRRFEVAPAALSAVFAAAEVEVLAEDGTLGDHVGDAAGAVEALLLAGLVQAAGHVSTFSWRPLVASEVSTFDVVAVVVSLTEPKRLGVVAAGQGDGALHRVARHQVRGVDREATDAGGGVQHDLAGADGLAGGGGRGERAVGAEGGDGGGAADEDDRRRRS